MSRARVPSPPSADESAGEWLNGAQARRKIGKRGQSALLRLVVLGQIRAVNDPGIPTRYCRADVERIAASQRAKRPPPAADGARKPSGRARTRPATRADPGS
jgi:hypothetical protein